MTEHLQLREGDEAIHEGSRSWNAPPKASAMVEALRGLGYSAATALSDIIDNSIAAGALNVRLEFFWAASNSYILVLDDGRGMDAATLASAMRLGERSPLDIRQVNDLGRFGLGLKTASFSQSRRLTVATCRHGEVNILRWDLDKLLADTEGRWLLLEGADSTAPARLHSAMSEMSNGTAVLWEKLDRIASSSCSEQDFLDLIDRVEFHLSMVFHRYLEDRKLKLSVNGRLISAWDPFLSSRVDTWRSGSDAFNVKGSKIEIAGFVLPHKDRLDNKTWVSAGGPHGWTAQQGFYVYRNKRLLVAGSWLGLGKGRSWTKDEQYRLARIRLDIPNTADDDWKIDIRKSTARPPMEARQRLTLFAEHARERARRVFAFRGHPQANNNRKENVQAWTAHRTDAGFQYLIDRNHPAISSTLEEAGHLAPSIIAMLKVIEQTVPVQQIWLDTAEARDAPVEVQHVAPPPEVEALMKRIFASLVSRRGMSLEAARQRLAQTEPFNTWPSYTAKLEIDPEK